MTTAGLCARPACGSPVAAWLTYDYAGRQVWLDDAGTNAGGSDGGGSRWALCAGHAERMRVPRGWVFQDRRTGPGRPAIPGGRGGVPEPSRRVEDETQLAAERFPTAQGLLPAIAG
jgi:Protein of unknown function (DUF3499)